MIYKASEDLQFLWGGGVGRHKIKAEVFYKNRKKHLLSSQTQRRWEGILLS